MIHPTDALIPAVVKSRSLGYVGRDQYFPGRTCQGTLGILEQSCEAPLHGSSAQLPRCHPGAKLLGAFDTITCRSCAWDLGGFVGPQ